MDLLRNYRAEDRASVIDIMLRNQQDEIDAYSLGFFDWLEKYNAQQDDTSNTSLVAERDGTVIGYVGALPCQFKIKQQVFPAGYLFNVFSDPQKRGIGIKMLKHLLNPAHLRFGSSTKRTHMLWTKLARDLCDSLEICEVIRVFGFIDPALFWTSKGLPGFLSKPLAFCWRLWLGRLLIRHEKQVLPSLSLQKITAFTPEINPVLETFSKQFDGMMLRDHIWLNWRFFATPFTYQIYYVHNHDELVGYISYRTGYIDGLKVLLIIEAIALGPQLDVYHFLLNHVYRQAFNDNIHYVLTNITGSDSYWQALKSKGAMQRKNNVIISTYPFFNGLETNLNDLKWFFSIADGDFEFANFQILPN